MVADPGRIPNAKPVGQNGFTSDMFGRLKTAHGVTLFDSVHRYRDSGEYSYETNGTATHTHLPNESTVAYTIGSSNGDRLTSESFKIFPYQPGKSTQVMQTFVMAPTKTNLRQRVGFFSRQNGIFLEQNGTDIYFVRRSYTTGSPVETRVHQRDWNLDVLDGSGKTDIKLDLSKAQILFLEIEWLGVGAVRAGFVVNGVPVVAHRFDHANVLDTVYMTTAALPVRYEIENVGATAGSSTFKQICTSVVINGGYTHDESQIFTAWRDVSALVGTDRYPLIALRMKAGRTDSAILPTYVDISASSAGEGGWALVKNPTSVTGGTWVTDPYNGNVEYNVTATSMSQDGIPMRRQFFSATNQSAAEQGTADLGSWDLQLGRTNADTPVSDVYVLSFRTMVGTMNIRALLGWHDLL